VSGAARTSASERARVVWEGLTNSDGRPELIDVPILVRPSPEGSRRGRIALQASAEDGGELGRCYVFNDEWYPGCPSTVPFSHYAPTLARVLTAHERRGETQPLRLQLLKAVGAMTPAGGRATVLLKFIMAPEHTLTGTEIEQVYGCPLSVFYTRFVGVPWDPQRRRSASAGVRGEAIHGGYRRAAAEQVGGGSPEQVRAAYLDGVRAVWINRLPNYFLDRPAGPTVEHTRPVEAAGPVVDHCRRTWPEPDGTRVLQERLFYAPTRGISGRADRIEVPPGEHAPWRLVEVKSGGSFGAERDPLTGVRRPGGLQSLSYREILRSFGLEGLRAAVEQVGDREIQAVPLERHPIVARLGLSLEAGDERAIDLIAQARNVGYCAVSGLYSGYDRYLLDTAGDISRYLRGTGGDYDLYARLPPCQICPAGHRGVCSRGARSGVTPLDNLFRYAPSRLYAYWAWFHRQLKAEESAERRWLHHLVSTPSGLLEGQEGVSVGELAVRETTGYEVRLGRDRRIETRIREDDRVLLTPVDRLPGQVVSIEGTVTGVGEREVRVRLNDGLDDPRGCYRLDLLGAFEMRPWQLEGLTDFLLNAVGGATVRGRQLAIEELPHLAQVILGAASAAPPGSVPLHRADDLNPPQCRALAAALALSPGELLLIQGPPGTGKTALIAHLAHAVLGRHLFDYDGGAERRPLLILANTHRAANEVVRKVVERYPELRPFVVRVGVPRTGMEPEVAAQTLAARVGAEQALNAIDLAADGPETLARLVRRGNRLHDHAGIFVGTLGAADAAELRGLAFEMVVVDEAGQATEPAMLQALRHLPPRLEGRLVLVGDHRQLPPVVSSELAAPELPASHAALGLGPGDSLRTSGFERLAHLHPHALLTLTDQYRMCGPICELVSDGFYDETLRPATPQVAECRLNGWLFEAGVVDFEALLARSAPVLFVDTSRDPAARDGGARFHGPGITDEARDNPREAAIVAALVADLMAAMPGGRRAALIAELGVISPYRKQNNRIAQELVRADPGLSAVRVDTVDRFQGGEREIVLVSLVNSNPSAAMGTLHADWRRMNVALSRARRLLVIVGDRSNFTREVDRAEEDEARRRYRRLFNRIDALEARGDAVVIDSQTLALGAR